MERLRVLSPPPLEDEPQGKVGLGRAVVRIQKTESFVLHLRQTSDPQEGRGEWKSEERRDSLA